MRAAGPLLERGVVMVGSARLLITAKAFCVQHGFVSASLNTGAQAAPVPATKCDSALYLIDHCATSVWLPHALAGARCGVPFARQVSGVGRNTDQSRAAEVYRPRVGRLVTPGRTTR